MSVHKKCLNDADVMSTCNDVLALEKARGKKKAPSNPKKVEGRPPLSPLPLSSGSGPSINEMLLE